MKTPRPPRDSPEYHEWYREAQKESGYHDYDFLDKVIVVPADEEAEDAAFVREQEAKRREGGGHADP